MTQSTLKIFRDDAYRRSTKAQVRAMTGQGGIVLDQTVFFAAGGGQPGDMGVLVGSDGVEVPITTTAYGDDPNEIIHLPRDGANGLDIGDEVHAEIDWAARYAHMRMHTALHLLCAIVPYPVTGGAIATDQGRLDFDMPQSADKSALTEKLQALIAASHPVEASWIEASTLAERPDLVRTANAAPPSEDGRIRVVAIGKDGSIDLQPCGGTHVASTNEIGPIEVVKIEKKGSRNRRMRLRFL